MLLFAIAIAIAIAISSAKAVQLQPVFDRLSCLFIKRLEDALLTRTNTDVEPSEIVQCLRESDLQRSVVTARASAVFAYDAQGLLIITPLFLVGWSKLPAR